MRKRTKENVLCVTAIICLLVCIITARAVSSFHVQEMVLFSVTPELARMGFPSKTLDAIAKEPEQNIAFRLRPDGNVFWDTEKLQKRIEDNMVRN